MADIEIARSTKLEKIVDIAKKIEIDEEDIEQYGKYKAKISEKVYESRKEQKDGKLILVTAVNPTPLGEGKTTISIAIADGLRTIGKNSIIALREPSLKGEQQEEERFKLHQWKTSTYILQEIFMP